MTPITQTPEWKALRDALRADRGRPPARRCSPTTRERGERDDARGRRPLPRLLQEPRHRRDACGCSSRSPTRPGCAARDRRDVRAARRSTSPRTAPCCTSRCARPRDAAIVVDGDERRPGGARGARQDGGLRRAGALAASGPATPASASATSSTSASAAPTSARRWPTRRCAPSADRDLTFRFVSQRRRRRLLRRPPRDLDPAETLFIVCVEDVHHARDAHQRPHAARAGSLAALGDDARRRQALRRRVDQRRRRSRSSASTPPTCSSSGTGSAAATRTTRRSACR